MKYLLLLAILLLVYLLWRHERRGADTTRTARTASAPRQPALAPREMVQCATCQVHLPREDALVDALGRAYCCAQHRRQDTG